MSVLSQSTKFRVITIIALFIFTAIISTVIFLFINKNDTNQNSAPSKTDQNNINQSQEQSESSKCQLTLLNENQQYKIIDQNSEGLFEFPKTPTKTDYVFDGWYLNNIRINQNMNLNCNITAQSKWITKEQNQQLNRSVPILMYHYFADNPHDKMIDANYQLNTDFDAQMKYLENNKFYYPTWTELEDFIDAKITLPKKSVIITDDDNHPSFYEIGLPIINKHHNFVTIFAITDSQIWLDAKHPPSKYITEESHTNAMHTGANSLVGFMKGLGEQAQIKDLQESAKRVGKKDVLAYPSGEFSDNSLKALKAVGFHMARTTKPGDVKIGTTKYQLPVRRMSYKQSLTSFIATVG